MNKGFWFEIVVPKMDPCIGVAQMCDATIVAIKTKSWAKKIRTSLVLIHFSLAKQFSR